MKFKSTEMGVKIRDLSLGDDEIGLKKFLNIG